MQTKNCELKVITIAVPSELVDCMNKILSAGCFLSRSELIRVALRDFIKNEVFFMKKINNPFMVQKVKHTKNLPEYNEYKVIKTGEVVRIPK